MSRVIDMREIQKVQNEFVKFLEERPGMVNVKNKFGVTRKQSLAILSELIEVENETKIHKWWNLEPINREKVLEELSDVLSHICNVANQLNIELMITEEIVQIENLEGQFLSLVRHAYELANIRQTFFVKQKIMTLFYEYMQLVYSLEFSIDELEEAYYTKLEKNYERFK